MSSPSFEISHTQMVAEIAGYGDALTLRGRGLDTAVPSDGDVPQYNLALDTFKWVTPGALVAGGIDYIQFNTGLTPPIYAEGQIYWDATDKTLLARTETEDVTLQVGQEMHIRATNKTGSLITNGTVVYVSGAQGDSPTIAAAAANVHAQASGVLGVATHDIIDNATGYVTAFGQIRGLNTLAWAAGSQLYLAASAGLFTDTIPTAPDHHVKLATVLRSHANEGIILFDRDYFPDLGELSDVLADSPVDQDIVRWDDGNSRWALGQALDVAGDQTITGLWSFSHAAGLKTNTITERTATSGVTIDGLQIKDAGLPEAAVTAHEAALIILESQIVDGSILARVGASESITGAWSFGDDITTQHILPAMQTAYDLGAFGTEFRKIWVAELESPGTGIFSLQWRFTGTAAVSGIMSIEDNVELRFGSRDHWMRYNTAGAQWELWSTTGGGGSTDALVLSVPDGANNLIIEGNLYAYGGYVVFGSGTDAWFQVTASNTLSLLTGGVSRFVVDTVGGSFAGNLSVAGALEIDGALNHDGSTAGFYAATPVTQQTGVAVSAVGIHAALVNLGLITA